MKRQVFSILLFGAIGVLVVATVSSVVIAYTFLSRKEHSEVSEAFFGAMARRWGK